MKNTSSYSKISFTGCIHDKMSQKYKNTKICSFSSKNTKIYHAYNTIQK